MNKIVSLFSGGGGLDLGFVKAGYEILWANDNESNAVATYKFNLGNHIVEKDINEIDLNEIPRADVVIGGPPCQAFSLSGNRDVHDPRAELVWRYIEIIGILQPKVFVFENVTGLVSAKDKKGQKILPQLEQAFEDIGYKISSKILNAAEYGVPQKRRRVFIVGLQGAKNKFIFPAQTHGKSPDLLPVVSVEDALDDLPSIAMNDKLRLLYDKLPNTTYQKLMRHDSESVTDHVMPTMSELDKYIVKHVRPGGNYMDIPGDVPSKRVRRLQKTGGHTTCYGRMLESEPAYTINTHFNRPNVGCNIHYKENRLISVREALRLQSFPDTYQLVSTSKMGKHKIVGNAVPPLLAYILAKEINKYL